MSISLSKLIAEVWVAPTFGGNGGEAGEHWERESPKYHYTPPLIDVTKNGSIDSNTREKATRLFYDFYAMYLLHRWLGSTYPGNLSPAEKRARQGRAFYNTWSGNVTETEEPQSVDSPSPEDDGSDEPSNSTDFISNIEEPPMGVGIVPDALRKNIERTFEEVTIAITRRLLAHLRLTLIQEFRYLLTHAYEWVDFRKSLLSLYNSNGQISTKDFDNLIREKLPKFSPHKDSVKRLLKFCKFYHGMGSNDPADKVPDDKKKPTIEPYPTADPDSPDLPDVPEIPTKMPGSDPDTTDYDAPEIEVPPGNDWETDAEIDVAAAIAIDKFNKTSSKEKITEGSLDSSIIRSVRTAIDKSGLTWEDIYLSYKYIGWSSAFGGARWGDGVRAFIDLIPEARNENIENMATLVDHIYDLDHNTGALLNKGGMYVAEMDLDRRAKITSLGRFIRYVSPMVKRIVILCLKYTTKHPDIEADIEKIIQSPCHLFTAEQAKQLVALKFDKRGSEYITHAPFFNKRPQKKEI